MYTRFLYPSPVANGDAWFQVGAADPVDTAAGLYPFVLESVKKAPETLFNNKDVCVPVIAEMFVPAD